ncbi:MAG: hypothetical protein VR65_18555 [Desulfobulbaceae bacterium BRH_c16a]|nr:MAG: hypothetical protein VR65_18555 [Desulfobulbaceae bacterium BRH_c16a]
MQIKNSVVVVLLSLFMLSGCGKKNWHSPWQDAGLATDSTQVEMLYAEAREKLEHAADLESLMASMESMQQVLAVDPAHREALACLGNLHILLGTAYTIDRKVKNVHFRQAMKYCELSMYSNPQFRMAVKDGKKPWEASHTLQAEDAPAMLFWVIALQYEFKEGMTLPAKIINVGWLHHGITFLDRIEQVDPEFGNGAVEFAYSICYLALPSLLGGDVSLGKAYLEKSIERGKGYLLPTWGKGKYFHQVTGDLKSARKDLLWVASQKPEDYKDLYPWRMHFIADAKLQLDAIDHANGEEW